MTSPAPGVPTGCHTVRPYLIVPDGDGILRFMKEAFGATEREVHRTPEGRKPVREVSTQDYGDRTGGVEDPAGNQWWIATRVGEQPSGGDG